MLSWDDIKGYSNDNPPKKIIRSKDVQGKYLRELISLKKKGKTIDEDLMKKLFPNNEYYVFIPNKFPYYVNPDEIAHYTFWINPCAEHLFKDLQLIESLIKKSVPEGKEFVWFQNILKKRSVKKIIHYHVFVKL
jgi:hypothetical protein